MACFTRRGWRVALPRCAIRSPVLVLGFRVTLFLRCTPAYVPTTGTLADAILPAARNGFDVPTVMYCKLVLYGLFLLFQLLEKILQVSRASSPCIVPYTRITMHTKAMLLGQPEGKLREELLVITQGHKACNYRCQNHKKSGVCVFLQDFSVF